MKKKVAFFILDAFFYIKYCLVNVINIRCV